MSLNTSLRILRPATPRRADAADAAMSSAAASSAAAAAAGSFAVWTRMKLYFELCKTPIALFAACSAATGFLISPRHRAADVILPAAAVFMLACGSSALNQFQERDIDSRMERTRNRPVPLGAVTAVQALIVSLLLITTGLLFLSQSSWAALGLGAGAVLWYNGVYTCLKKKTAFAVVPGALVGAIPPAIGWISGGGSVADIRLLALCALFFMWQIPHFWLLVLRYGAEYEKAGLPSLTRVFTHNQLARITFTWILCMAAGAMALPLYGMPKSSASLLALVFAALWLLGNGATLLLKRPSSSAYNVMFRRINLFVFALMALLSLA